MFTFLAIINFLQGCNFYNLRNYCILKTSLLVPQKKDSTNNMAHTNQPKGSSGNRGQ